jgi:hypothetical protein
MNPAAAILTVPSVPSSESHCFGSIDASVSLSVVTENVLQLYYHYLHSYYCCF